MYHGNMYHFDGAQQQTRLTSGREHMRRNPKYNCGFLQNRTFIKAVVLLLGLVFIFEVEDILQLGKVIQPLHRTLHAHLCSDVSAMERRENDLRENLSFLSEKRRKLCHFYWLDKEPGTDAWEYFYQPSYKTGREDVQLPSGDNNIAFVVTITHCPDDTDKPPVGSSCHPDDIFFDEMSMLRFSTCHWNAQHHDSESSYESTMYAIIHTNAVVCPGSNGVLYDRAKLLQDQGYWVIIHDEPVYKDDILGSLFLKQNIDADVGIRDLIKLYAYKLVNHPLVVLIDYDTFVLKPLDEIFDALLDPDLPTSSSKAVTFPVTGTNKGISTGMFVFKPSLDDFNKLLDTFANSTYTKDNGWGGTGISGFPGEMGTAGLLKYYYSRPENPVIPLDRCIYNNGNEADCQNTAVEDIKVRRMLCEKCGKPNECRDHMDLDDTSLRLFCHTSLNEWFKGRVEYEYDLWDKQDLPPRDGTFMSNIYLGYCKTQGKLGYGRMVINEALAPTKIFTAGDVIDPVCDTTCPQGTYLKTDCTCTIPEEPCQACPYGMKCYEPQDGRPLMCIDCSCGFCNKDNNPCCEFNGVNNCKSATSDQECKLQEGFFPAFSGNGHACSGVELNMNAIPNGCGCKPTDNLPCTYDPKGKDIDTGCFICTAKDLAQENSKCATCYACMERCDSCVSKVNKSSKTAVQDMQDCMASSEHITCHAACDPHCRKSPVDEV